MKLLVIFLLTVLGRNLAIIIKTNINAKEKAKELLFTAKVRNFITDDNKVNVVYIREVAKKCFNASDKASDHIVAKCGIEKSTPEETAAYLYDCVVKENKNEHLDDNKEIKYKAGMCQLRLINFFKNGKINQQVVLAKLLQEGETKERADEILDKCSEKKDTPEETANNFIICLAKEYNLDDS